METPLAIFFSSFSPTLFFVYTVCKKEVYFVLNLPSSCSYDFTLGISQWLLSLLALSTCIHHCVYAGVHLSALAALSGCLNFMMDFLLVDHECQHRTDLLTSEAGGSLCTSAHTVGGLRCCLEARWLFSS